MKRRILGGIFVAVMLTVAPTVARVARASTPTAMPGYTLTTFATGLSGQYYRPDSLATDGLFVYVGYQNDATNDGTSGNSTIVQYTMNGSLVRTFPVQGHNDGLRVDPSTQLLWSLSNEDANPVLTVIDPSTASETVYALPTQTPFVGGYDDLAFTSAGTFISDSNPSLDHTGVNTRPAIERLTLLPNNKVVLTPVLMGDAMATDSTTGARVRLNLTDPDSLAIDPTSGDIVLNDQADSQLIFMQPGDSGPRSLRRLLLQPSGTILDETTWATSNASTSSFLIADHGNPGTIYRLTRSGGFTSGSAYATVSNDPQTYTSTMGTLDTSTGAVSPVVTGFSSPKGLLFLPQ